MKYFLSIIFLSIFAGCTSVETSVLTTEKNVVMNSTEKCTFSSPEEKLKLVFSPDNGGQIVSIFWEGEKIAEKVQETYPNKDLDFKKLSPRVIDDGTGLIIVDSKVSGEYQLRRSYSIKYLENTEEHVVEVIYNVKNYSSEKAIDQQWIQALSLPKSLNINIQKSGLSGSNEKMSFEIEAVNVFDLSVESNGNLVQIGNTKQFKLGTKERLSWKVLYKLKSAD